MSVCVEVNKDLEIYKDSVTALFESGSDFLIDNGRPEHAAVLFEQFFLHAKKCVRIFCKNLLPAVFERDEVIKAAQAAVNRGVIVKICTQEPVSAGHKFLSLVEEKFVMCNCKPGQESKPNFATMDDVAFRFENDPSKIKAKASANRPKLTQDLVTIFDEVICCG